MRELAVSGDPISSTGSANVLGAVPRDDAPVGVPGDAECESSVDKRGAEIRRATGVGIAEALDATRDSADEARGAVVVGAADARAVADRFRCTARSGGETVAAADAGRCVPVLLRRCVGWGIFSS